MTHRPAHSRRRDRLAHKLLRSHMVVAAIGLAMTAVAVAGAAWFRAVAVKLAEVHQPMAESSLSARIGLDQSISSLRGWVATGEAIHRDARREAWEKSIRPALRRLERYDADAGELVGTPDWRDLLQTLRELDLQQSWVEDVARTPGDVPSRVVWNQHILPGADRLFTAVTNLIEEQMEQPGGKDRLHAMADLRGFSAHALNSLDKFITSGLDRDRADFWKSWRTVLRRSGEIYRTQDAANPVQSDLHRLIDEETRAFELLAIRVIAMREKPDWDLAAHALVTCVGPLERRADGILERIHRRRSELMTTEISSLATNISVALALSVALFFAMGTAAVTVSRRNAARITQPILALSKAAGEYAAGRLDRDVSIACDDEIGDLTRAFNAMRESLSRTAENHAHAEEDVRTALREIENQKLALDEHSIVSITDTDGNITYVNDKFCDITGYSRDELIGKNHRIVKSDKHPPEFFKELWATISSGNIWKGEINSRAKGGATYWVDATIVPCRDDGGTINQYIAIRTDISQRKRAAAQMRADAAVLQKLNRDLTEAIRSAQAATRAKSEFLANMSHEIRTPMTAILGFAETISENPTNPDNVEAIAIIRRNGECLLGIINDILDLSKIEARKMSVERVRVSTDRLVRDIQELLQVRTEAKGLELQVEYDGRVPRFIESDPARLRQILINIVGNAIKFTERGSVRIIARFEPDDVKPMMSFDIVDTGLGMTDEQAERVFQAFSQADSSTVRQFGGTGLGLAISKRFAQLLGGDVIIVDTQPQKGTRFRVTVSAGNVSDADMIDPAEHSARDRRDNTPRDTPTTATLGERVLLAEDGPDNQRLISHILTVAGADVTVSENGQLAIEAALRAREEGRPFDVILMDMQMPVMDGYTATRSLREQGYTGAIIALTAHAMATDRQACLDAGCDDYTTKPIDRKKLIALIASKKHTPELVPERSAVEKTS